MVGLTSGKLTTMDLKQTDSKGNTSILTSPREAWTWHTAARFLPGRCRQVSLRPMGHRTAR